MNLCIPKTTIPHLVGSLLVCLFFVFPLTLGRSFKLAHDQVAASWADRDGYQTASGSATLNLRAGDKVDDSFCDDDDDHEGDNDDYGKYFDECGYDDFDAMALSTHSQVWLELEEGEVYEPSHSRRGYASFNGHRLA